MPKYVPARPPTIKERLENNILWVVLVACAATAVVTAGVTWTIANILLQRPATADKYPNIALSTPTPLFSPLPSPSVAPPVASTPVPSLFAAQSTIVAQNTPTPSVTASVVNGSLEQWNEDYHALDGHFAEREAYIRRADGKRVHWTVQ